MEEQRQRARVGAATAHGSEDRHERVIAFAGAAPPTRFVGYETLRATTGLAAVERDDGRALVKLEESPFYAEGGGQVADSGVLRWDGGEARVVDVYRVGEDQALEVEPTGRDRRARDRGRSRGRPRDPPRDDAQPHRDPPPARGAARAPRHPRAPGRLGGAARQAALRLHPRPGARRRGAARDRGPRQRVDQGEPAGALAGDGARRGRAARRDGALRREVRRVGAGGRGRRRLARALRRHPRRQHGRGRHLQDRLGGLQRRQRAPDRGAHGPGRDRLVPRARGAPARGRRAARLAAGPAQRRPPRCRAPARGGRGSAAGAEAAARRGGGAPGRRGGRCRRASSWSPRRAPLADQKQLLELANRVQSKLGGDSAVVLGGAEGEQGRPGRPGLQGRGRARPLGGRDRPRGGADRRRRRWRARRHGPGRRQGRGQARRGAGGGAGGDRAEGRRSSRCASSPSTTAPPGSAARSPTRAAPWRRRCR